MERGKDHTSPQVSQSLENSVVPFVKSDKVKRHQVMWKLEYWEKKQDLFFLLISHINK